MANEKRLIDANALRTQFDDIPPFIGMTGGCVQQYIDKAPTVDAVEVVHGRWGGWHDSYCSNCGCFCTLAYIKDYPNYCPNCGADMRGETE